MRIETSLYDVGKRFLGMREIPGKEHHPFILWCFSLTGYPQPYSDEDSWCSAWLNGLCYVLGLQRSGSAAARSWLRVGSPVEYDQALVGMDIVVLQRGAPPQPGPEIINAPGHVTIFAGFDGDKHFKGLGGNQDDCVSVQVFPASQVLGVRRLIPWP